MLGYGLSEDEAARLQPVEIWGSGLRVYGFGWRVWGLGAFVCEKWDLGLGLVSVFGKLDAMPGPQSVLGWMQKRVFVSLV